MKKARLNEITKKYNLSPFEQKEIKKVYKDIVNGNVYAKIESVAKSGMSRRISFYVANKNRTITRITPYIGWLTGWANPKDKYKSNGKCIVDEGLHVGGCGMNMVLHTLSKAIGYPEVSEWNQTYSML